MSEYVKSVDPNHMVALGDEGFYNKPYGYYNEYTTQTMRSTVQRALTLKS